MTKSRVLHIRIDPEIFEKVRRAALKVDRRPCDWVRQAIAEALAQQRAEQRAAFAAANNNQNTSLMVRK